MVGGHDVPLRGNVISTNGSSLLSDQGSSLIGNNGGALISDLGGSLLGNHGAGLLGDQRGGLVGSYRLRGGTRLLEAPPPPAIGDLLPTGGLIIFARDTASGRLLSLGVNNAGTPVYAIESNAGGHFSVFLPAAVPTVILDTIVLADEERVVVAPRLTYRLIAQPMAGYTRLDEDTSIASESIMNGTQGILSQVQFSENPNYLSDKLNALPSPVRALTRGVMVEFQAAAHESALDAAGPAIQQRITRRLAELLVGYVDVASVRLSSLYAPRWQGGPDPALEALVEELRLVREACMGKLREAPAFFSRQPYVTAVNAKKPAEASRWSIQKPADLNRFLLEEFIVPQQNLHEVDAIFTSVGLASSNTNRFIAAVNAMMGEAQAVLRTDRVGAKAAMLTVTREWRGLVGGPSPKP
jgi:hypothetical protein